MTALFADGFEATRVPAGGADFYVRRGGPSSGPYALLLHGHTQSGAIWRGLAPRLAAAGYDVIVPDLQGTGRSSIPAQGYAKRAQAEGLHAMSAALRGRAGQGVVVGHDLGAMIAYAFAASDRRAVTQLVMMEATVPGLGIWDDLLRDVRACWHFGFVGPFAEALIAGREAIYLERFWTEFAGPDGSGIGPADKADYVAAYVRPGGVRGALAQFDAFDEDTRDNVRLARERLACPALGIGGGASFGPLVGEHVALLSSRPATAVIEGAGHWLLDERPDTTADAVVSFLRDESEA